MAGLYIHAGLNVLTSKLQLVEVFGSPDEVRLENLNEEHYQEPIDFKTDSESKILSILQKAFKIITEKKALKTARLSFSLPLDIFYVSQLHYDNTLLHQDLMEEFKWEFSVLFPFLNQDEIILQYVEIDRNMVFTKNTALAYAIERRHLKIFKKFCIQNNLSLGHIDNAHLSSERALVLSDSFISEGLRLSVLVSKNYLSLILSLDGKTISQKVHKLDSYNDIRQIIEHELAPSKSKNIIKGLIQAAYITGEDVTRELTRHLTSKIGIPFIIFNPFDKLTVTNRIGVSEFYTKHYNSFSSAAGIAYRTA